MFSIVAAVAVHSKGNMILFPWGYAADPPPHPNADEMSRLAYKMYWKIKTNTEDRAIYVPGTACQVFGHAEGCAAGGATDDWYSSLGIPYSYTWELPQGDSDGFHDFRLPASNIVRVGKHLLAGFGEMAMYLSVKMNLLKDIKLKTKKYVKSQRIPEIRYGPDL